MTADEKAAYERGVRDALRAAADHVEDTTCTGCGADKFGDLASEILALSPPATDGGAKKITDLAKNNRPEELLPATVVPSERAAAQACAFCDAPLDLCSCGGMAP